MSWTLCSGPGRQNCTQTPPGPGTHAQLTRSTRGLSYLNWKQTWMKRDLFCVPVPLCPTSYQWAVRDERSSSNPCSSSLPSDLIPEFRSVNWTWCKTSARAERLPGCAVLASGWPSDKACCHVWVIGCQWTPPWQEIQVVSIAIV